MERTDTEKVKQDQEENGAGEPGQEVGQGEPFDLEIHLVVGKGECVKGYAVQHEGNGHHNIKSRILQLQYRPFDQSITWRDHSYL